MNTNVMDAAAGTVTVTMGAVQATLTPESFSQWANVLISYLPLLLAGYLIWRIRAIDAALRHCESAHRHTSDQLLLAFTALQDAEVRSRLPSARAIIDGKVTLQDCQGGNCDA